MPMSNDGPEGLKAAALRIREKLGIQCVVIHPRDGAAAATREEAAYVKGPFVENPKISTGAGDHFNAGFALGELLGLSIIACLTVAVATSGQYVRSAESPNLPNTVSFLERWSEGAI